MIRRPSSGRIGRPEAGHAAKSTAGAAADPGLSRCRGRIRPPGRPVRRPVSVRDFAGHRRVAGAKAGQRGTSTAGLSGDLGRARAAAGWCADLLGGKPASSGGPRLWPGGRAPRRARLLATRRCASLESLLRRPDDAAVTGDWLSGRAPRSHRGGHWFDPSIAHQAQSTCRSCIKIAPGSEVMDMIFKVNDEARRAPSAFVRQRPYCPGSATSPAYAGEDPGGVRRPRGRQVRAGQGMLRVSWLAPRARPT
jgi:hypothetical protein